MPISTPTEAQLKLLQSLPDGAPVGALNLFRFRENAQYEPGDPEYDTPAAAVSGREAYARYTAEAGPRIVQLGGRVVFSTPVDQTMIGPENPAWDLAAIMFFPTRAAFKSMLMDPEFQAASRHRKAALADHCMLHLNGEPFVG